MLNVTKNLVLNPSIEEIENEKLRKFYEFWIKHNSVNSLPSYEDFKVPEVIKFSDSLAFIEFEVTSYRFRVVEMGKSIIDSLGGNVLGEYWDTLPESAEAQARFSWAVENKLPYFVGWPTYKWSEKVANNPKENYNAMVCPLFDKDEHVVMLAMVFEFMD